MNPNAPGIHHIEYGCANNVDFVEGDPELQFYATMKSVREVIEKFGAFGRIYLNDLTLSSVEKTANYIAKTLRKEGVEVIISNSPDVEKSKIPTNSIELVLLAKDFTLKRGLPKTKTAMLRNATSGVLTQMTYGSYSNRESTDLQTMANRAANGLDIIYIDPVKVKEFIPGKASMEDILIEDYKSSPRIVEETYYYFSVVSNPILGTDFVRKGELAKERFWRTNIANTKN